MKRFKSLNSTSDSFEKKTKGCFDQSMLDLGIASLQAKKRKLTRTPRLLTCKTC